METFSPGELRSVDWSRAHAHDRLHRPVHVAAAPRVPHDRSVVGKAGAMLQLPAGAAEVVEASQVSAEVRSLTQEAAGAEGVFQVGVNLHLLGELDGLDLDESSSHCLHVGLGIAEGDTAASNGVLESVRVDAGIDYTAKQVGEHLSQTLGSQHTMQCSNKDRFAWIQPLGGAADKIGV